ncbi:MAG: hypothetical protein ABIN45_04105, partial [Gammaproteobacteria bacterium]
MGTLAPRLKTYAADPGLHWTMQGIEGLDTAGALLLWRAWGNQRLRNLTLRPEHSALFDHLSALSVAPGILPPATLAHPCASETTPLHSPRDPLAPLILLGQRTLSLVGHVQGFIALLGQLTLDIAHLARHPMWIPWREISANLYRTGAQALAIT